MEIPCRRANSAAWIKIPQPAENCDTFVRPSYKQHTMAIKCKFETIFIKETLKMLAVITDGEL